MAYTGTTAEAFQAAVQRSIQAQVLENLRDDLTWSNPSLAEQGRFDAASDMLTFLKFPDMSSTTPLTPLTEGVPPTARSISMTTVNVSTDQYGDIVNISDIAKVKAPRDVVSIAAERTGRVAKEVMDTVTRDNIFLGGTPYYAGDATTRATIDDATANKLDAADLILLRSKMKAANVPLGEGGYYKLYLSINQAHDLRAETTASQAWAETAKYTSKIAEVDRGEIGALHGFRIIEVDTAPTFTSTLTVYAGLALGGIKGWGSGELQSFQTYHVTPGGDHSDVLGQVEAVGWKVNFGCAPLNNGYYFRVESAATTL
jgi:N4-gp56 family major capsid protein